MYYGQIHIETMKVKGKDTCYIRCMEPDGVNRVEKKSYVPHTGLHMFHYPSELMTEAEAVQILCTDMEKAYTQNILKISKEIFDIREALKKYNKKAKKEK